MNVLDQKIKKIGIPQQTLFLSILNWGLKGVYISRTCFPDVRLIQCTVILYRL